MTDWTSRSQLEGRRRAMELLTAFLADKENPAQGPVLSRPLIEEAAQHEPLGTIAALLSFADTYLQFYARSQGRTPQDIIREQFPDLAADL
jgi:hypothetical protein